MMDLSSRYLFLGDFPCSEKGTTFKHTYMKYSTVQGRHKRPIIDLNFGPIFVYENALAT